MCRHLLLSSRLEVLDDDIAGGRKTSRPSSGNAPRPMLRAQMICHRKPSLCLPLGLTELDVIDALSAQSIAMPQSRQAAEQSPVAPNQPSMSRANVGTSVRVDQAALLASSGSTQAMGGVQHAADDGAGKLAAPAIVSPAARGIASPAAPGIASPAAPATEVEVVEILHTPAAVVLQPRRVAEPTSPAISPSAAQWLPASTPEGLEPGDAARAAACARGDGTHQPGSGCWRPGS